MTDGRETKEKAEGQEVRVRGRRKKHDTAGPDLSRPLEGDIPDSCRRACIILGPLLARDPQKTAPLIRIKSAVRLCAETTAEKARNFLRLLAPGTSVRRRFFSPTTEVRRSTEPVRL